MNYVINFLKSIILCSCTGGVAVMKYQYRRTIFSALFLVSPVAFSAAPIAYDGWTVTNGTIDASSATGGGYCDAGNCTTLVSEPGMLYQEVVATDSSGFTGTYLRLILTDENADSTAGPLQFSTESFVPYAENSDPLPVGAFAHYQGIAAKQVINGTVDNFQAISEIQRGNMREVNSLGADDMYSVKFSQQFAGTDVSANFSHTGWTAFCSGGGCTQVDSDFVIGRSTDMEQTTNIGGTLNPAADQLFVQRTRDGIKGNVNFLNPFWGTGEANSTAGSMWVSEFGDPQGTAVSWGNTGDVTATWIVQDGQITPGTVTAFQRIKDNNTLATDTRFEFDVPVGTQADPFAWDANFGAAPSFAVP
jgi:hypothetical protein